MIGEDEQEKRKKVVALKYEQDKMIVPKVVAKGEGKIAEHILQQAKAYDIPIQNDPTLVELLGKLDINETIPEELYLAVAEVFIYIYQIDKQLSKGEKGQ